MLGRSVAAAAAVWVATSFSVTGCGGSEHGGRSEAGNGASSGTEAKGSAGHSASGGNTSTTSGGNTATTGADASTLDGFLASYAKAVCETSERCWSSLAEGYESFGQSCAEVWEVRLKQGAFSNLAAAIADGRIEYDADAAQACLDAIGALSCEDDLDVNLGDDCEGAFVGSLEAGADCTLDVECGAGLQCVVGASCPGTCGPRVPLGGACTRENRCEAGLACLTDAQEQGTCIVLSRPGESCSSPRSCPTFYTCLDLDSSDPESTGTCEPRDQLFSAKLDEPCAFGGAPGRLCEPGLVCSYGDEAGSLTGVCRELVGSGEGCTLALPEPCPDGEYCRISDLKATPLAGVCSKRPELGDACANPGGFPVACPINAYCSEQTGVCEACKPLGETCAKDDNCLSLTCANQKCAAPLECEPDLP